MLISSLTPSFLLCFHILPVVFLFCFLCAVPVLSVDNRNQPETISSGSRTSSGLEKRTPEPSPLARRKTYDKAAADRAKVKEIKQ